MVRSGVQGRQGDVMHWMQTAELVVLVVSAAILMWDDQAARSIKSIKVRVKNARDRRR